MKTKYFVHNGKLITASSKKEAIHQIVASSKRKVIASKSKSQDLENYLVKTLKSCLDENFIRANSKEIEDILDKEGFYWNSRKGRYEYEIYKSYDDELEPWWFEQNNVDSFDAYWEALFDAYLDAETQPYYDAAKAISELCAENDVEVDDDYIDDCLREEIPCDYPNFLDDEIPCTIEVKATDETIKLVFGTSSLINIASKFVKGNLRPDLQSCLKEYLLAELNEDDLKDVSAVKSELEKLKKYKCSLFGYNDCMLTVREYLSTQNPKDDRASKFLELNDEFYFTPDSFYGSADNMIKIKAKIPIEYIDCRVGRHDF